MNINKSFYLLFLIDVLAGIIVWVFTNFILGLITAIILLFINGITFYFVQKIQKIRKQINENRK
ncbi:MAG: hypothetical protein PHR82_05585 [Endomicrobiaceae bacterium]|nr:hypothetical protein [Endomicrobiaceae bacterium]